MIARFVNGPPDARTVAPRLDTRPRPPPPSPPRRPAVNPAGALFDAQAFNDQQSVNRAWEGEVEVSTRITDEGWVAEVAGPEPVGEAVRERCSHGRRAGVVAG
ncbi:MAG: hypothetical protein OXF01_10870 [Gemmatimonadetes bacterium]|nr:hypothetical protein [Gemmatimonadota bacterium]